MAYWRNLLVQYRSLRPVVRFVSALGLLSLSCEGDRPSGTGGSGGDVARGGGDSLGGSSGTQLGSGGRKQFVPMLECGGSVCGPDASCCTEGDACGSKYGEQVFTAACVGLEARGGARSTDCPVSPRFCKGSHCQEFQGCFTASSNCGYWVEGFDFVAGEKIIHVAAELECVSIGEFREP